MPQYYQNCGCIGYAYDYNIQQQMQNIQESLIIFDHNRSDFHSRKCCLAVFIMVLREQNHNILIITQHKE